MIEYKLSNIGMNITLKWLFNELRNFGFIQNKIALEKENNTQSTVIQFKSLKDNQGFEKYCVSADIKFEKLENNTKPQNIPYQQIDKKNSSSSTKLISNASFYYYKDQSYGVGIEDFSLTQNFSHLFEIEGLAKEQTFELTTIYPGLLVGSGYNHPKRKDDKDDYQLGFFFDHTTGLPIISGSSIKGLIRHVCKNEEFMKDVYEKTVDLKVFEDGKTIFYDAYIIQTKNKNKTIFGSDYITSHFSDEPDGMFKEPNPVKFLKILPDVTFKFQFEASNEDVELFKKIILDFGLGAKTNVGYGKFIE